MCLLFLHLCFFSVKGKEMWKLKLKVSYNFKMMDIRTRGKDAKKSVEIIYIFRFHQNMIICNFWKLKYLQWSSCPVCLLRLKKGKENLKYKKNLGANTELKFASRLWFTRDLWIPEMIRAPWACQASQRRVLAHSSSSAGTPRGPDMMRRLLNSAWLHSCSTEK